METTKRLLRMIRRGVSAEVIRQSCGSKDCENAEKEGLARLDFAGMKFTLTKKGTKALEG